MTHFLEKEMNRTRKNIFLNERKESRGKINIVGAVSSKLTSNGPRLLNLVRHVSSATQEPKKLQSHLRLCFFLILAYFLRTVTESFRVLYIRCKATFEREIKLSFEKKYCRFFWEKIIGNAGNLCKK
jgi:hypothetical protein